MRLTAFILLSACLAVSAAGHSQTVTLNLKKAPLQKVFRELKKQTGYDFFYESGLIRKENRITIDARNASLSQVLDLCFINRPLTYTIEDKTIIITPKQQVPVAGGQSVQPILIDVTGRIVDENGDPVAGATVQVKGLNKGTTTDNNGEFALQGIGDQVVLVITGTNIERFESAVKGKENLFLSAKTKVANLQEVVINKGYYMQKQLENTGNVFRVESKDIQKQPVTDLLLALSGRVPGMNISQTSGLPGAYSTVRLRGANSIPDIGNKPVTVNNPLYIIDGVPFGSASLTNGYAGAGAVGSPNDGAALSSQMLGLSPFNSLNPLDIESIEVLKDADATAIYGSRGANGVVLITTKKGKAGQTRVDLNVYSGVGKVVSRLDLLNTQQYLEMRHEAFRNDNKNPTANDNDINGTSWDTTRYTDWQKVLIGNPAYLTNAQVNISGGNATTQFNVGGAYSRQTLVYPGDHSDKKISSRLNLTHASANNRFRLQAGVIYSNDNNNMPAADLSQSIMLAPNAPALYDANGNLNWQLKNGVSTWNNPLRSIVQSYRSVTKLLLGNLNLSYRIWEGLELKANAGYTQTHMDQTNIQPATAVPPYLQTPDTRAIGIANTDANTWIVEPQLSYHKKIGQGIFDANLGSSFQDNSFRSVAYGAFGFASDQLISNISTATTTSVSNVQESRYRYNAFFGRLGYNWKERYLLNVTGRRDGSSRFGPGRQFGNFGAIGVGWVFSREKFIQNKLGFLSFGKLRASYGSTGNDNINDFRFLSLYSPVSLTYQGSTGLNPVNLANPEFGWERVNKLEAGIELGFFHDRLNISASYYRNRTGDQLIQYVLSSVTGFPNVQANLPAIIQNSGQEYVVNANIIRTKKFLWSSAVNLTLPETKLVSYPGIESTPYFFIFKVGASLFSQQKFHLIGINPQTGLPLFETKNANGVPTAPDEYTTAKPVTQQLYGGWQNTFTYQGFQLDFLVQFVKQNGNDFRRYFPMPGSYNTGVSNQPVYVLDRWQKPGDEATYQKFSVGAPSLATYNRLRSSSDAIITDASFVRLKNVSLSWTVPLAWKQKIHCQNARIYVQGQNLLTITDYRGLDPETGGLLPPLRMIVGGIQFTL